MTKDLTFIEKQLIILSFSKYSEKWECPAEKQKPCEIRKTFCSQLRAKISSFTFFNLFTSQNYFSCFLIFIVFDRFNKPIGWRSKNLPDRSLESAHNPCWFSLLVDLKPEPLLNCYKIYLLLSNTKSTTIVSAKLGFGVFQYTLVLRICFYCLSGSDRMTTRKQSVVEKQPLLLRFRPLIQISIFQEISSSLRIELFYSYMCQIFGKFNYKRSNKNRNDLSQFIFTISKPMVHKYITILLLTFIFVCLISSKMPRFPVSPKLNQLTESPQSLRYTTLYFDQKVSHFNFKMSSKTWKQKYLMDNTYWNKDARGPILMYCGNEGPIEMFYKNTGWYNDFVSKQLKGLLLYPEHRYFGVSMPFGDQKTSYLKQNLVYLTTDEAMMDYVEFLRFIKKTYCKNCPVIVFGGSFGGMIATWMRMKYPFIVDAAHAASAPIYYYRNREGLDLGIFYQIVTKNFEMHSVNCPSVIREGLKRLIQYSQSPSAPTPIISGYFNLCKPLKNYRDIQLLIDYIMDAYSYLAMLNYPYPTSFLKNLTAWPANSSCTPIAKANVTSRSGDKELFNAIRESIEYYYSYGVKKCNEIYEDQTADEDMSGWNILACGDQAMPMDMDGVKDMFYPAKFDYSAYSASCQETYGIQPDYDYVLNHFGGVTDDQYKSASRIIFTNGGLDPWSGASPLKNLTNDMLACYIDYGAHHLDLRPPNAADPRSVNECRALVLASLKNWIGVAQEEGEARAQIRSQ